MGVSPADGSPVAADDGAGTARRPDRRPAQTIRKVLDAGLEELRESSSMPRRPYVDNQHV
jgi:hypothetical protein